MSAGPDSTDTQVYLPDFCAAGTLFIILLVAELVAIVLTLAAHAPAGEFLLALSKISFFVLWLAILGTAVMCKMRRWLLRVLVLPLTLPKMLHRLCLSIKNRCKVKKNSFESAS